MTATNISSPAADPSEVTVLLNYIKKRDKEEKAEKDQIKTIASIGIGTICMPGTAGCILLGLGFAAGSSEDDTCQALGDVCKISGAILIGCGYLFGPIITTATCLIALVSSAKNNSNDV